MQLELDVWREFCRHPELEDALERVLALIAKQMPAAAIAVRRLDVVRSRLEPVACAGPIDGWADGPFELSPPALSRALSLFARDGAARAVYVTEHDPRDPIFGTPRPLGLSGDTIVAPLADSEGPSGLAAVFAAEGEVFSGEDVERIGALGEAFAVALSNERRMHELAQLREAALAENRALLTRLGRQNVVDTIVGENGGLRGVVERVEQVARTDVPVLILGETGSGKEVIARAIHERSDRRAGPIEDIPALASHFATRAGQRLGGTALVPSAEDIQLLLRYPWPGNVRELATVIERAAILGHGKKLEIAAALGAGLVRPVEVPALRAPTPAPAAPLDSSSLDAAMAAHIERALISTRGRIEGPSGAAALLGINPHTLRARMRKLRINWARFRQAVHG